MLSCVLSALRGEMKVPHAILAASASQPRPTPFLMHVLGSRFPPSLRTLHTCLPCFTLAFLASHLLSFLHTCLPLFTPAFLSSHLPSSLHTRVSPFLLAGAAEGQMTEEGVGDAAALSASAFPSISWHHVGMLITRHRQLSWLCSIAYSRTDSHSFVGLSRTYHARHGQPSDASTLCV